MLNAHMTFHTLFPIANPPILLSKVMPKQVVQGTSVHVLCKTVFGDKVAKNVHGDSWSPSLLPPFTSSSLSFPPLGSFSFLLFASSVHSLTLTNLCIQDFGLELERRRKKLGK